MDAELQGRCAEGTDKEKEEGKFTTTNEQVPWQRKKTIQYLYTDVTLSLGEHVTLSFGEHVTLSLGEHVTLSLGEHVTLSFGEHVTLSFGEHVTLSLGEHVRTHQEH